MIGKNNNTIKFKIKLKIPCEADSLNSSHNDYCLDAFVVRGALKFI